MHKDCADRVPESLHNSFGWPANAYYLRISSREQPGSGCKDLCSEYEVESPNRLGDSSILITAARQRRGPRSRIKQDWPRAYAMSAKEYFVRENPELPDYEIISARHDDAKCPSMQSLRIFFIEIYIMRNIFHNI